MVPKSSKEIIKSTAKDLNLDDQLVKQVVDFYWSEVKESLVKMEDCNVLVAGFGTFKVSAKKLATLKEKYIHYLNKLDINNFRKYKTLTKIEDHLQNIERVFSQMRDNMDKKKQVKAKKDEYKENLGE